MDLGLGGRVSLVAGSTRGIGLAVARELLQEGARVAITGRTRDTLDSTATALRDVHGHDRVLAIQADMTSNPDIQRVIDSIAEHWRPVQVLVANVGTGRGTPGWSSTDEEWLRLIELNLLGAERVVKGVLPEMIRQSDGSIVTIASIAGVECLTAPLAYSAAKAALINYSKNLARQLGPHGIRVNVVAPGNVLFEGGSWHRRRTEQPEDTDQYIRSEVPLRRFGTVDEIAAATVFLASQRASFTTGACLVVDGGQTRGV